MRCPRCGVDAGSERYCSNCGAKVTETETKDFKSRQKNSSYNEKSSNDELVDVYIGPNSSIIKSGRFSFAAFTFGPYYLLSRKLYKWGVILLFVESFLWTFNFSFLLFFERLCLGLFFNKLYIEEVKNRVETIKRENPNANILGLENLVRSRGGIGLAIPIILFILIFLSLVLFGLFMFGFIDEDKNDELEIPTTDVSLYYDEPEGFYILSNTSYYKDYYTADRKCSFKIAKWTNSTNHDENIKEMSLEFMDGYKDRFIEINDYLWKESMEIDEEKNKKKYILNTNMEWVTYNIEFNITIDEEHAYCEDSYEFLKDSLEIDY